MPLLAASALAVALGSGCPRAEPRPAAPSALTVSVVSSELALHGLGDGDARPSVDATALARECIGEARSLRLAEGRGPDGARLRLTLALSRDGASGDLHASVSGRIDRAGEVPLDWRVDRVRPPGEGASTTADLDAETTAAVRQVLAALDAQAAVLSLSEPDLIEALDGPQAPARAAATRVLAHRRVRAAVEPLCRRLEDGETNVELEAARALAVLRDERAIDCLVRWGGSDLERMGLVADALVAMNGERALATLRGLASGAASGEVRRLAAGRLAAEQARRRPAGEDHDHDHAHEGAGAAPPMVRELVKALTDDDRRVRLGAARALAESASPHAVEPLCGMLDAEDAAERLVALQALSVLGNERAIPCLLRWSLEDERRLLVAIPVVVTIGGPESAGVLEMLARDHPARAVREMAAAGLRDVTASAPGEGSPGAGSPPPEPRGP